MRAFVPTYEGAHLCESGDPFVIPRPATEVAGYVQPGQPVPTSEPTQVGFAVRSTWFQPPCDLFGGHVRITKGSLKQH